MLLEAVSVNLLDPIYLNKLIHSISPFILLIIYLQIHSISPFILFITYLLLNFFSLDIFLSVKGSTWYDWDHQRKLHFTTNQRKQFFSFLCTFFQFKISILQLGFVKSLKNSWKILAKSVYAKKCLGKLFKQFDVLFYFLCGLVLQLIINLAPSK
jgi:hypothetical protein